MTNNQEFIQATADKIIESLKQGTAPWIKPWKADELYNALPYNPVTNKPYNGINSINLLLSGYEDPRWLTFKQALSINAIVKKGEKATLIQYWQYTETVDKTDEQGNVILGENGKPEKIEVQLERPKVFFAYVFNAEQINNMPKLEKKPALDNFKVIEEAENILKASGATIEHKGNRAYYSSTQDKITLPPKEQFLNEGAYYTTALHELGHWTGHEDRLNRDLLHPFGSKEYAKEELRAEISSFLFNGKIGLDYDPAQHLSYIESWVEILEDKPSEIFKATSDATKIVTFLEGLSATKKQVLSQDNTQKNEESVNMKTNLSFDVKNLSERVNKAEFNNLHIPLETVENLIAHYGTIRADDSSVKNVWAELSIDGREYMLITNPSYGVIAPREKWGKDAFENLKAPHTTITQLTPNRSQKNDLSQNALNKKTFLYVPFIEKNEAKAAGAKWDIETKAWYAPKGADINKFSKWLSPKEEMTYSNAQDEFKAALEKAGLIIEGNPIMDGKIQRVAVQGDKGQSKSGAYVAFDNGHPAGFIQNYKTGYKENWKSNLSQPNTKDQEIDVKNQIEANKALKEERERTLEQSYERTASLLEDEFTNARWAHNQHPYLQKKGFTQNFYLKQDKNGNLLIPLKDINGKHWASQRIFSNGDKMIGVTRSKEEKDQGIEYPAKKHGNFHLLGAKTLNNNIKEVFVCEGFATAASVYLATNKPTIMGVDAGNLEVVITNIKEKYPKMEITIAADNDIKKELDNKPNVGKSTALGIQEKYPDIKIALPQFSSEEVAKGFSDFNDLHQSRGLEEVKKQLKELIVKQLVTEKATTQSKGIVKEVLAKKDIALSI